MQVNEVVVNGVTELSLVNDTVSEDTLLEGTTAHDASGNQITGKVVVTPVDSELNVESENAIQNKAVVTGINNAVNGVKEYANGIISNPNLLDNPDFSINQRGETEYSGSPGYCVDRWYRNTAATVTPLEGGGVSISYSSETNASIYQKVENAQKLCGKVVTISASVNGTIHSISGTLPNDLSTNQTYALFVRLDGSTDVPTNSTPHLRIQVYKGGLLFVINYIAKVDWVKLELGSVATAFVPPNPATELAKCQRYLVPLDGYKRYTLSYFNTGMLNFLIPLNTAMRVTPSIVYGDNGAFYVFTTKNIAAGAPVLDLTDAVISIAGSASDGVVLRVTKSAHNVTDGLAGVQGRVFLSAEL